MHALLLTWVLAPIVDVRGHSRLTLTDAVVVADGLRLRGELRDRDLFTALPGRRIRIELRGATALQEEATTDAGGLFEALFQEPGEATVLLRFAGDPFYVGSAAGPLPIRADRPPLILELRGPASIRLAEPDVSIEVAAREAGVPAAIEVEIHTGLGRRLAALRTGVDPTVVRVPTRLLGPPGPVRLVATSERGGRATLEAVLMAPVLLELFSSSRSAVPGDRIEIEGAMRDPSGPIADAPIVVLARGKALAWLQSDAYGRFRASLDSGAWPLGDIDLVAAYSPHVPWREQGRSSAVMVRVVPPQPLPLLAILLPAAIVLAAWLWRKESAARTPAPAPPPQAGLRPVIASSLRAALRRPDRGLCGTVWDPFHGRPVAGARLLLARPDATSLQAVADEQGVLRMTAIPDGTYQARVGAPGFVTLCFDTSIPHRGELSGFRVDLEPVRKRALRLWCERAEPIAKDRLLHATPTDVAQADPALSATAHAFLQIFYSGRPQDESSLASLDRSG